MIDLTSFDRPTPERYAVVTVRMEPELHERLMEAAIEHGVSMNKLCLAALADGLEQLKSRKGKEESK